MRNINSVLINNSIRGSEEIFKTLDLLHKIGVIPTKKKRATKSKAKTAEDEIKQDNDMGGTFSSTGEDKPPSTGPSSSGRFPPRAPPALALGYDPNIKSIENINKAVEDKKAELKSLENKSFNNPQIEDIRREHISQLGLLTDQIQKAQDMGNLSGSALYQLDKRFQQIEDRFRKEPSIEEPDEMPKPFNPFESVKGSGDAVESTADEDIEDEDIDMTNQGSQDIPEDVLKVDVAPQPEEVLEDEEVEDEAPLKVAEPVASAQAEPIKEEPKAPLKVASAQAEPIKEEPKAPIIDKYKEVEKFYGFTLPRGKNQGVEAIKDYVRTLANESQTTINYANLKNRQQWEDKMNQLINQQYQLIESGDAVNYEQRKQAVIDDLELPTPSSKLEGLKAFLAVLSQKLEKPFKPSEYTKKENVENRIKQLINEHYKTLG
jgi:hypothetical protein